MGMLVGVVAGALFTAEAGAAITAAVGGSVIIGAVLTGMGSAIGSGIVGRAVDSKNEADIEAPGTSG